MADSVQWLGQSDYSIYISILRVVPLSISPSSETLTKPLNRGNLLDPIHVDAIVIIIALLCVMPYK